MGLLGKQRLLRAAAAQDFARQSRLCHRVLACRLDPLKILLLRRRLTWQKFFLLDRAVLSVLDDTLRGVSWAAPGIAAARIAPDIRGCGVEHHGLNLYCF